MPFFRYEVKSYYIFIITSPVFKHLILYGQLHISSCFLETNITKLYYDTQDTPEGSRESLNARRLSPSNARGSYQSKLVYGISRA